MACRFLDLASDLIEKKAKKHLRKKIQENRRVFDHVRSDFFTHTDAAWGELVSYTSIPEARLQQVSLVSHQLARSSRDLINDLYSFCGLEAADIRTEMNRVWRNFHTAAQHSLFSR